MANKAAKRATEALEDLFWSQRADRRRQVATALFLITRDLSIDPRIIEKTAVARGAPFDAKAVQRVSAFGRAYLQSIVEKTPFDPSARKGTLQPLARFAEVVDLLLEILRDEHLNPQRMLGDQLDALAALKATHDKFLDDHRSSIVASGPEAIGGPQHAEGSEVDDGLSDEERARAELQAGGRTVLSLLSRFIDTPPDQIRDVYKSFIRLADPSLAEPTPQRPAAHFHCYRFHSHSGLVVKSFLRINASTSEIPACMFTHAFAGEVDGPVRRTRGYMIPGRDLVYCLGAMEKHEALKFMVISRPRGPVVDTFTGLTISMDDNQPVAARFLLRRTEITRSADAAIGPYPLDALRDELGKDLPKLRNRIEFGLEEASPVFFDGETRPINEKRMVEKVDELLRDSEGNGRFKSNGKDFNPAEGRFYTFNSALKAWSREE